MAPLPHTPRIPDIPGDLVPPPFVEDLRSGVAQICQQNKFNRFPGSQPVSFGQSDLTRLENEDFWVCEKSDGVRVLFFVHTLDGQTQNVYLIDRHNNYRMVNGFFFPHHENPRMPLRNTILDGELLIDQDPRTNREVLRLLAFDCLVVDNQNVMSRTLDKRYGRLQEWFYKPYKKMISDHPHMLQSQPFELQIKLMNLSYGLEKVFNEDIPKLQHGTDGLIFTCLQSPYTSGTDRNILKWKPPNENSIDFKLVLRFPPDTDRQAEPDFFSKPEFFLYTFVGGGGRDPYEPFDELYIDDEEWERLKATGEQIDDRIVEVYWDTAHDRWRMMRFRDDKPQGNHKSVVENIIKSIVEGVEKEDLLARSNAMRTAWKARHGQQTSAPTNGSSSANSGRPPAGNGATGPGSFSRAQAPPVSTHPPAPTTKVELRFGPLPEPPYSKVGGPREVLGFKR